MIDLKQIQKDVYQNYTRLIKRLKNRVINNSDELLEIDIKSR